MSYRGNDLDLRTPAAGPSYSRPMEEPAGAYNGTGTRGGQSGGGPAAAMWVDDTVLACCNHAYDVALAHGSAEVRLEHFVHALTRVEAAAALLEQRGYQEAQLRRESAAVIASQIPINPGEGRGAPRASATFSEMLRRASEHPSRVGGPATVADVLRVLSTMGRDIPGVALLLKHAGDSRTYERPLPERATERVMAREEPRYAAPPRYMGPDRRTEAASWAVRYDPRPDPIAMEAMTHRLEALDGALRHLQADFTQERRMLSELVGDLQAELGGERRRMADLLADVQHEVAAQRAEAAGFRTRLQEQVLALAHGEAQQTPVLERIHAVEKAIAGGMSEGARNWAAMGERLKTLERAIERQTAPDWTAVAQRLDGIEQAILTQPDQGSRWTTIEDRLQMMGRSVGTVSAETTRIAAMLGERDPAQLNDRLRVIESVLATHRSEHAELKSAIANEMKSLERVIGTQQGSGLQMTALVNERFQTLGRMLEQQRAELDGALRRPLNERLGALEVVLRSELTEQRQAMQSLGTITERVHTLEGMLVAYNQRTIETAQNRDSSISEIHEALIKLGSNQQTLASNQQALAGTFDEWRAERSGDLGIIDNRMRAIEAEVTRPLPMLESLAANITTLQRVTIEQGRKRSWLKQWLFGTQEVWEAGWGAPTVPAVAATPPPAPVRPRMPDKQVASR